MTTRTDGAPRRPRKLSTIPALALMAVAFAALTSGCVQGHDPRNDSSRLDVQPRAIGATSLHNEPI
jgi:hypothetical protein